MMAKGHAYTGAIGGIFLTTLMGYPLVVIGVVSLLMAGCALGPDWDHPEATAARTFGFVGRWLARLLDLISAGIYNWSKTPKDVFRSTGHRTFSHTLLFCLLIGMFFGVLAYAGIFSYALAVLLFIPLGLRSIFKFTRPVSVVLGMIAATGLTLFPEVVTMTPWHLGLFVFIGFVIHLAGDYATNSGIPLLWPINIQGKRWFRFRSPIHFYTGQDFETKILTPIIKILLFAITLTVIYLKIRYGGLV